MLGETRSGGLQRIEVPFWPQDQTGDPRRRTNPTANRLRSTRPRARQILEKVAIVSSIRHIHHGWGEGQAC